jgi:hypothetical protein
MAVKTGPCCEKTKISKRDLGALLTSDKISGALTAPVDRRAEGRSQTGQENKSGISDRENWPGSRTEHTRNTNKTHKRNQNSRSKDKEPEQQALGLDQTEK